MRGVPPEVGSLSTSGQLRVFNPHDAAHEGTNMNLGRSVAGTKGSDCLRLEVMYLRVYIYIYVEGFV